MQCAKYARLGIKDVQIYQWFLIYHFVSHQRTDRTKYAPEAFSNLWSEFCEQTFCCVFTYYIKTPAYKQNTVCYLPKRLMTLMSARKTLRYNHRQLSHVFEMTEVNIRQLKTGQRLFMTAPRRRGGSGKRQFCLFLGKPYQSSLNLQAETP